MSNLLYDDYYVMTLSNDNYTLDATTKGAFAGNGKITFYNSMHKIGCDQTIISIGDASSSFNQIGKYKNNIVESFNMCDIRLFTPIDNSNITYSLNSQTLNMLTGQCSSIFSVNSNDIHIATVENNITPLRQFPYCVLQRVSVTAETSFDSLDIHHIIQSSTDITNTDYNNNVIFNEKIYDDKGLYIMNAKGIHKDTNTSIACASCYLNTSNCLGFNVLFKKQGCHQQLRYSPVEESETITFDILTATMTSADFPEPLEEVKRILMNIAFREPQQDSLVEQLENDSSNEWYTLWSSDILINHKLNISIEEQQRILRIRRYVRQSLYSIFCCVRLGINAEVNPLHLSYIDTNGNLFYDSDIWLVPTLLFLSPPIAKTLLEFRYKGLEQAVQLAASYGYKGSKYPYQNDVLGYKTLYWDVASPLHIFNNAIIAINAWNYFRLTQDIEWLQSKGYPIMKNTADFLVGNLTPSYGMMNIIGLGGRTSENHAFTLYATKLALKYTIQATIQLEYTIKTSWQVAYQNIKYPLYEEDVDNYDVISYDSTYTNDESLQILDPLLILLSYYSEIYFQSNTGTRDYTSIIRNLQYYENSISQNYQSHPINLILIACMYGLISQADISYLSDFFDKIDVIIDECGNKDYWGNLMSDPKNGIDIALHGLFIFMFITVIGGIEVVGGVNEGKIRYMDYGIKSTNQVNLPSTWRNVVFSGIGGNQELYIVTNSISN